MSSYTSLDMKRSTGGGRQDDTMRMASNSPGSRKERA